MVAEARPPESGPGSGSFAGALRALLTRGDDDPLPGLLALGCAHLRVEIGMLSRVDADRHELLHVVAPAELGLVPGSTRPLERSHCLAVTARRDISTLTESELSSAAQTEFPFRSYAGAPLIVGGEVRAVLSFADRRSRPALSPAGADIIGALAGVAALVFDRQQLKVERDSAATDLARLTLIDPLTQLCNRRGIETTLARLTRRYRHGGERFTAVMIDLDDFKHINDTFGHATGDDVLAKTAALIQSVVRPTDVVGRIGGDEFLAILPNTTREQAVTIAERVREKLASDVIKVFGGTVTVTVTASIGVAEADDDTTTVRAILRQTSSSLRDSKDSGKNRISW